MVNTRKEVVEPESHLIIKVMVQDNDFVATKDFIVGLW